MRSPQRKGYFMANSAKIAVLGYGVVGSGTVEVFYKNKESLEKKSGKELDIKYILDVREDRKSVV